MKRRVVCLAMFVPLLACLMGASSIDFAAGQPNPNPGGVLQSLEGKGSYVVDPTETFGKVFFQSIDTKTTQSATIGANANNGTWDSKLALMPGNYDSWATLYTVKNGGAILLKTKTVNVNVK